MRRRGLACTGVLGVALVVASPVIAAPPSESGETVETSPSPGSEPAPEPGPDPELGTEPTVEPELSAGDWYARGIELGSQGQFESAAEAFLRSYAVQPTPEALFNAGLAYQNAGRTIAAIEAYRRFLGEAEVNPELGSAASAAITELLRQVGTLKGVRYSATRPPAELYVAGRRIELDELPVLLPPGPLEIEVVDDEGHRARESYELAAGEALVVDLRALLPEPTDENPTDTVDPELAAALAAAEQAAARRRQETTAALRTTTWIGLGLTGAGLATFGTFAGLAGRERNAYLDATCLEFPDGRCPEGFEPSDPEGHERAYSRFRTASFISFGVTGGLAVGTLVVGLIALRRGRVDARSQTQVRARVRVAPRLGGFALEF